MPVLEAQVGFVARRAAAGGHPAGRQDAQDLIQDVLVELLRNEARELRRWSPERGLSLEGFARLVARRYAMRRLFRGRRELTEATEPERIEAHRASADDRVEHRDELGAVLDVLEEHMGPRDRELFTRLFLEEERSADVAEDLGMTMAALKKWRSRLYQRARSAADRIRADPSLRARIAYEDRVSPKPRGAPTNLDKVGDTDA